MELNIYNHGEIEKTYETESHRVLYGTIQKISRISDKLSFSPEDAEFYSGILAAIPEATDVVEDVLYELFPDLTADEMARTDLEEIALIIYELIKFQTVKIKAAFKGGKGKN